MKEALFIGGTGTISMAITNLLATRKEWHLTLLNRGYRQADIPEGVDTIAADINDEEAVKKALEGKKFDTVCDFIGFVPSQLERDYRIFKGITKQFMYISSASAYNKLPADCVITEGTTLANPYWEYSRNKIACEEYLMKLYREEGFPVTIIRPSHTYDNRNVPLGVHGSRGSYQVIKRMLEGKRVIIHGDGTSIWTMTYNEDFAVAFAGLMANPHAIGEAFQITNDEKLTWNQIYQTIADVLGVELRPYYVSSYFLAEVGKQYDFEGGLIGDKSNTVLFDNTKVKRAVPEFKPSIHFEEGIRRCLDNILSNKSLQIEDPEFDEWCDRVINALEEAKARV